MDNLKIIPKPNNKQVKLKIVERDDGVQICIDDYYEFWLAKFENQSDGSLLFKVWSGGIGDQFKLSKNPYECSGDTTVYKIEQVK